jgi:DNA-binding transcriptional LysR family regulator
MDNLNDLYMYAMVVEHGGFSKAERALGIPKSRLSRRITELEADLGVRLLQRGSRHFVVTEVGQRVYQHVQSMLTEAQAARDVVAELSVEPRGVLRVSVPVDIAEQQMAQILPEFMQRYPHVKLHFSVTNRRIDLLNEGIDVALRVRDSLDNDGNLVMRNFGQSIAVLVASPEYLDRMGRPQHPSELIQHQTLSNNEREYDQQWTLHGPNGKESFDIKPQVLGSSFALMSALAEQGHGITFLPLMTCVEQLRTGQLEIVLPNWRLPQGIYHAVFASRRGMLPAVRVFIDFLAEKIPPMLQELQSTCTETDSPEVCTEKLLTPVQAKS